VLKAVDGFADHLGDDSNETLLFEGTPTHNKRRHLAPRCDDSFKGKDGTSWSDRRARKLVDMIKQLDVNPSDTIDTPLSGYWRGHLVMREGQSTYCIHGGGRDMPQVDDTKDCGNQSLFVALPIKESNGGGFFFVHYFSGDWLQASLDDGGEVTWTGTWESDFNAFCIKDKTCYKWNGQFYVQSLTRDGWFELNVNLTNKHPNPFVVQRRNSWLGVSAQWAHGSPRAEFAFERNYNCYNKFRCGHGWELKENWKMVQCDEKCTCLQCCKPSTEDSVQSPTRETLGW